MPDTERTYVDAPPTHMLAGAEIIVTDELKRRILEARAFPAMILPPVGLEFHPARFPVHDEPCRS